MIKRQIAKIPLALAVAAAGLTISAPMAFAAGGNDYANTPGGILGQVFGFLLGPPPPAIDTPDLFNIPVNVIPFVDVPESWDAPARDIGQESNDFILDNHRPIEQGAGAVGGALCTITPFLGAPCSPIP